MHIGRLTGALGLLVLLLAHAFSLTAIWVEFKVQQATIEQTLCENRQQPELGCHGHCVLTKRLRQAEEATSNLLQRKASQLADVFLSPAALVLGPAPVWPLAAAPAWAHRPAGRYDHYEGSLFHPPDPTHFVS